MPRSILVVDDDPRIRSSLARVLGKGSVAVEVADSAESALARIAEAPPDLMISDLRMPGMSGLELLQILRDRESEVDVILMTAHDDLSTAASAMKEGAADFLVKPLDIHHIRKVVERVFRDRRTRNDQSSGEIGETPDPTTRAGTVQLIGHDPKMVALFKAVGQMASSRASVIIRGESGTGKELIAQAIHEHSPAAREPFVAVNCTALPENLLESELFGHVRGAFTGATRDHKGRFSLAGKGTLLLDEVGDTTPAFQAKLLRVLQDGEYHPVGGEKAERTEARVLAATHQDLEAMVEAGTFRADLFFRLRVMELIVPPLRERRGDIPELAEHFVQQAASSAGCRAPTLTPETVEVLQAHDWPGNVRELENCLTRAVVLSTGGVIRPEDLGLSGGPTPSESDVLRPLESVEAEHISRVLAATEGNRSRASEVLGISRPRLRRLIEKYGLE
jgi:DNA-binding NtrC family response regulator